MGTIPYPFYHDEPEDMPVCMWCGCDLVEYKEQLHCPDCEDSEELNESIT